MFFHICYWHKCPFCCVPMREDAVVLPALSTLGAILPLSDSITSLQVLALSVDKEYRESELLSKGSIDVEGPKPTWARRNGRNLRSKTLNTYEHRRGRTREHNIPIAPSGSFLVEFLRSPMVTVAFGKWMQIVKMLATAPALRPKNAQGPSEMSLQNKWQDFGHHRPSHC